MAILYVRSTDGDDADNGSTWALAKATLAGAFAAASAGDIIFVSHNHAGGSASVVTLTPPGTAASPCYVICVNDGAEPPTALATTATITQTGSGRIQIDGFAYFYGITFSGATTSTSGSIKIGDNTSPNGIVFHDCNLKTGIGYTHASGIAFGSGVNATDDQYFQLINTGMFFHSSSNQLRLYGGRFFMTGGAVTFNSSAPNFFIDTSTTAGNSHSVFSGVDLSVFGSGKTLVELGGSHSTVKMRNCKLGASVNVAGGTIDGPGSSVVELINSDSTDTNYRYWYQDYAGTIEHETTIVRTGGASDGTTPISREMISSPNSNKLYPLVLSDLVYWNESTGANTLTIHIITDNVTLTDQECWLEVEYLGTSGFPLSSLADDADSITDRLLSGSASNQATSTETWTTTGLTTPVKQQLSVSVTPQEKGPIRCRVVLAKPNTTVYVCPKVEVS